MNNTDLCERTATEHAEARWTRRCGSAFFAAHSREIAWKRRYVRLVFCVQHHVCDRKTTAQMRHAGYGHCNLENISKYVRNRESACGRPWAHGRGVAAGPLGSGTVAGHRVAAFNPPGAPRGRRTLHTASISRPRDRPGARCASGGREAAERRPQRPPRAPHARAARRPRCRSRCGPHRPQH